MRTATRVCQYCQTLNHDHCTNARCGCGCSPGKCVVCKRPDRDLDADLQCSDRAECRGYLEDRYANSPVAAQIRECRELARQERQALKALNAVRAAVGPQQRPAGACECCGEATKGGRFLPGHDSKYASVLAQQLNDGQIDVGYLRDRKYTDQYIAKVLKRASRTAAGA